MYRYLVLITWSDLCKIKSELNGSLTQGAIQRSLIKTNRIFESFIDYSACLFSYYTCIIENIDSNKAD